jgi:hypothetical protein
VVVIRMFRKSVVTVAVLACFVCAAWFHDYVDSRALLLGVGMRNWGGGALSC